MIVIKLKRQIFEREEVGGRLREMKISGKSYDSGGSIIHSENFYAKALTEKVGKSLIAANQIYLIHNYTHCYSLLVSGYVHALFNLVLRKYLLSYQS